MSQGTAPGTVYLVGAGPGDPGLITVRGAELLARAEVVVYDRLVHPSLLELAPRARHVYAGKSPGGGECGQEQINELLVREARAGRVVVRLKGGDPFVFGRGGEECEALARAGVPFEVVPGVTSAVAAPAYAGIPLTHREHASWAALATGHEDPAKGGSALDWGALARAGTAVFLMGVGHLREIASRLLEAGRDPRTPAAVVASGTLPSQRVVLSTLADVAAEAERAGVGPPAVLVVGPVVSLAPVLDWFSRRPLRGRRVFVTRTREQAGRLAELLREAGAEPLAYPAIRVLDLEDLAPLQAALERLRAGGYAWVVFTSANAVEAVERRLAERGWDARVFAGSRLAAIGPGTAERLAAFGLRADLLPATFTSAGLAEAFPAPPRGSRGRARAVLLPRAAGAPEELPRLLVRKGWRVDEVPAYRTVPDHRSVEAGRAELERGVDAVLFTSSSTVRSFVELWGAPPEGALVCCIGPQTAQAARELGLRVDAVADEHTVQGLVAALVRAVRG